MLSRPRLKGGFQPVSLPQRHVFLLDERRPVVLEGAAFQGLLPLLDGTRSVTEIAGALAGRAGLHDVLMALAQLEQRGCLSEGDAGGQPGHRVAFLDSVAAGSPALERLEAVRVGVRDVDGRRAEALEQILRANGLTVAEPAGLLVVLAGDYLEPALEGLNREALTSGLPWMLAKPAGTVLWVGPVFVPGRTGCWSCLAQRLRSNRQMDKYLLSHGGVAEPRSRAALAATVEAALDLVATEVARWLVSPAAALEGKLLSLDLLGRTAQEHVLVRRPQCRSCGGEEQWSARPPGPVTLQSRAKRFRSDGGHRTVPPEETYERYRHHVSPIVGAVSELRPALGGQSEVAPSFVAGHNFSMGVDSVAFLQESLRGVSGGKGSTRIQAMVSGLCEAIERYSGVHTGEEYTVRGRYRDLAPRALHPNECMGFSEEQYRGREDWNRSQPPSRCVIVPRPFDPAQEVDWAPLWSLRRREERLLPAAYCYYGHPEFAGRWCIPDSNGCAAGNVVEEAILQGFLELVERDAVALWWYNRVRRPGLDLDSFALPYLGEIQDHYASLGRRLWVLDLTADLGITTLACVSARTSGPAEDVLVGFGAHFDPQVALLRAVTEVNQFLPSVARTRSDGSTVYRFGDELALRWWREARTAQMPYLVPDPERPARRREEFEDPSSDDLAADVELCVERAARRGLDVLVQDLTRPDIGLPVVRVVVPGLCHFWRRLGFQRLYDVPVQMGWLEEPLGPEALNPYTVFF
jgi:ribosomal protein S12 methylthiotransferase accessory factor